MIRKAIRTRGHRRQEGYALLMVVFFMSILLVGTMTIGLRVLTEGRRQKEQEMIWRGKQYTRGVKMYYRKLGRFPTSLDDLTKPKIGNLRFMRQQYKDPMNKDDGAWRLIYVGPTGQLIGSLKPQNNFSLQLGGQPAGAPGTGTPANSPFGSSFGSNSSSTFGAAPGAQGGFGSTPAVPQAAPGGAPAAPGANPATNPTGVAGVTTPGATPDSQNIPTGDTPTIVGGNIIGVGSKINQSSVLVYEQASNYRLFEFIWNPAKDAGLTGAGGALGAPGGVQGNPLSAPGQGNGVPGIGAPGNPNGPGQPNPGPPLSNPNPQQQQPQQP